MSRSLMAGSLPARPAVIVNEPRLVAIYSRPPSIVVTSHEGIDDDTIEHLYRRYDGSERPPDAAGDAVERYNLIVIDAGSGGLTVAAGGAAVGARVALLEKHRMGSECLNYGCVPSKAVLRAAHVAHTARIAGRYGVRASAAAAQDLAEALDVTREEVMRPPSRAAPLDLPLRPARGLPLRCGTPATATIAARRETRHVPGRWLDDRRADEVADARDPRAGCAGPCR